MAIKGGRPPMFASVLVAVGRNFLCRSATWQGEILAERPAIGAADFHL